MSNLCSRVRKIITLKNATYVIKSQQKLVLWVFRERQFWTKRWRRFYKTRSEKLARIGVELFCGKSLRRAMRIRDDSVGRAVRPLNYEHALLAIINRCGPSHAFATSRRWANTELFFGTVKQELASRTICLNY